MIVQNGNRYTCGEDSSHSLNGKSASEEKYFSAFGMLATGEVLSANDGCVSAEEILKQFQSEFR